MHCVVCGNQLSPREVQCPVCYEVNGAPNVRYASTDSERAALDARVRIARDYCSANGLGPELKLLEDTALTSSAVMTRSYGDIFRLLESKLNFYVGFAIQVDSGTRLPSEPSLDAARRQWENAIHPNYSDKVLFASLSASARGLRNYGGVDIVLKEMALEKRASVFESNGLDFARRINLHETIPPGFKAPWQERAKVVIAKLYKKLSKGITLQQIDALLQVDAGGGTSDDFVEVHVFGGVNSDAFEKISADPKEEREKQSWNLAILYAQDAGVAVGSRP